MVVVIADLCIETFAYIGSINKNIGFKCPIRLLLVGNIRDQIPDVFFNA